MNITYFENWTKFCSAVDFLPRIKIYFEIEKELLKREFIQF